MRRTLTFAALAVMLIAPAARAQQPDSTAAEPATDPAAGPAGGDRRQQNGRQ